MDNILASQGIHSWGKHVVGQSCTAFDLIDLLAIFDMAFLWTFSLGKQVLISTINRLLNKLSGCLGRQDDG